MISESERKLDEEIALEIAFLSEKIRKLQLKRAIISITSLICTFQHNIEKDGDKDGFFKNEIERLQRAMEEFRKEVEENNDG